MMRLLVCVLALCSNDPLVLGDERLAWDAVDRATSYEICDETETACVTVAGTTLLIDGTSLAQHMGLLRVRACNQDNPEMPPACSAWAGPVEFIPTADVRHTNCRPVPEPDRWACDACEIASQGCRRLPHLPLCPEGTP